MPGIEIENTAGALLLVCIPSSAAWAASRVFGRRLAAPLDFGSPARGRQMLGDVISTATKRRLALRPGSEVLGLDQLPEALLPLVLFARSLGNGATEIAAVALLFTILDVLVTPLRHHR